MSPLFHSTLVIDSFLSHFVGWFSFRIILVFRLSYLLENNYVVDRDLNLFHCYRLSVYSSAWHIVDI